MNPIALEAQTLRELAPDAVIRAAARAGFAMAGVWIVPGAWTAATTRAVRGALADTGLQALDAEVIRIRTGVEPDHLRIIDIAAEVGAAHVVVVSFNPDRAATIAALAALAEYAAPTGVRPVFEFGPFSAIARVQDGLAIVEAAGDGVGLLPDPIHLERSGGTAADLARVPAARISYAQICDAGPPPLSNSQAALLEEARFHRLDLGTGLLPLTTYLATLPPGIPLSNETRSLALERRYPDPDDRAAALATTMRAWLHAQKETL